MKDEFLTNSTMSTIFQKIIDGEIPADIVYEDEQTLAFLDIQPINKGHTLVIPKVAFQNIFDEKATPAQLCTLAEAAMKVGRAVKEAMAADGINIIMNNGEAAGQEVFHAHIHIVPRFKGDDSLKKPVHVSYKDGESSKVATQIIAAIDQNEE